MRYVLFILCLSVLCSLSAENIPKEKAILLAEKFFKENRSERSGEFTLLLVNEQVVNRSVADNQPFYIFNDLENKGFVIIAGDDRVIPVLGYSLEHSFPQETLPCNVSAWLDDMELQVKYALENNILQPDNGAADDEGEVIVRIDTPLWGQEEPFNAFSPELGGQKTPSGCVMTAMGIVMRHHQWPERGKGVIPGYSTSSYGHTFPDRELGHRYDWENMPYSYTEYTQEQANQVATLLFDLGMMMKADYAPGGTGAYSHMIVDALQTYMDYDKDAKEYFRNDYSSEDWHELLQKELDNGRPIIYGGYNQSMSGGHSFVLDGYTSGNYYSVNWGWDGKYNGYFLLSALEPAGHGTGGNGSNFNYNQSAVMGLMRSGGVKDNGNLKFERAEDGLNGIFVHEEFVERNKEFTVSVGIIVNKGIDSFSGTVMLALTDKNGIVKEDLYKKDIVSLEPEKGNTIKERACRITELIEPGDRIRVFYKVKDSSEWSLVKGDDDCVWQYLVTDEYTIDESTNIQYNKFDGNLLIETKKGVKVKFEEENGTDRSNLCRKVENGTAIDVANLSQGTYLLKLDKGNESRVLKIRLKGINCK